MKPTGDIPQSTLGGRDEMIKASIKRSLLQDLRERIFVEVKADFGWNRSNYWSREWLYKHFGLYGDYRIRYLPKALPAR